MNVESSADFALALDNTDVQSALSSSVISDVTELDAWLRRTPASTSVIEAIVGGLDEDEGPELVAERLAVLGIGWPLPSTIPTAELRAHNHRIMAALADLGIDVGFYGHLSAAVVYARLYERIFIERLVVPEEGRRSLDLIDLADSGEWQAWVRLTGAS